MIAREFFERDPLRCARDLVGASLRWGDCSGVIVETEAYDECGDAACHTFFRPSTRAFVQRNPAGTSYVYLNYGVHWMLNVLVKGRRRGFVLIRAIEPREGIEAMAARRGLSDPRRLCSGPGKLTRALAITGQHHEIDLCANPSFAFHARSRRPPIVSDERIGISMAVNLPWRFSIADNQHVSVKPRFQNKSRAAAEPRPG